MTLDAILARGARMRGIPARERSILDPAADVVGAPFAGRPRVSLVIASSPRTGSNLLVESLRRCGIGAGAEFWNPRAFSDGWQRWGVPTPIVRDRLGQARRIAVGRRQWWFLANTGGQVVDYQRRVEAYRTGANGVFVVKAFAKDVEWLESRFGMSAPELLDGPQRWVFLRRVDKIGQAISHHRASVTLQWRADGAAARSFGAADVERADLAAIRTDVERWTDRDRRWRALFDRYEIAPTEVTYEQLTSSFSETIQAVARLVGVQLEGDVEPPLERQADELSAALRARLVQAYPELGCNP